MRKWRPVGLQFGTSLLNTVIDLKKRLPEWTYRSPPNWYGYLLIMPAFLLASFLFIGLLILGILSFLTFDPFELYVIEPTFQSWRVLFTNEAYYVLFGRTFGLTILITFLAIACALPYSYLVTRVKSSLVRKLLLLSIFVPFFTGVIIRTYGWIVVLGRNGLVNSFFGLIGLGPFRMLGNELGVTLGLLQVMIPFAVIMMTPALQNIEQELEMAAESLGATRIQTFRHVVLPLSLPGIGAATVVVFTITSARFAIPGLLGRGQVDFVANVIYSTIFGQGNYPFAATLSLTLVAVSSMVVFIIFSRVGIGTLGIGGDEGE